MAAAIMGGWPLRYAAVLPLRRAVDIDDRAVTSGEHAGDKRPSHRTA